MNYLKNAWNLLDNYVLARLQKRHSTAAFWYLPEPPNLQSQADLLHYKTAQQSPLYLLDYREKLQYGLKNAAGIIVLPYQRPIGQQINPEAAFQYALALHDQFYLTKDEKYFAQFKYYADFFLNCQTQNGLWPYTFDWYGSAAPWYSALAQARGAAVMLRAAQLTNNDNYLYAAKKALNLFLVPTAAGGFLQRFAKGHCDYFEEYPKTPTGVINGFMSALMNIWELQHWTRDKELHAMWQMGIDSLEKMLPFYSNGWWSLYDLDEKTPIANVNSPRYHLLEIHYLKILSLLSDSSLILAHAEERARQLSNKVSLLRALTLKSVRKIIYR